MTRDRYRPLMIASTVFVAGNVLHTADHFRRGGGLPLFGVTPEVLGGGVLISVGAVLILWLTSRGHPWAPPLAAAVGLVSAIGVSASHLAPPWGVLSNSYLVLRPDALAWIVVSIEIAGGLMTGLAGIDAIRRARGDLTARAG